MKANINRQRLIRISAYIPLLIIIATICIQYSKLDDYKFYIGQLILLIVVITLLILTLSISITQFIKKYCKNTSNNQANITISDRISLSIVLVLAFIASIFEYLVYESNINDFIGSDYNIANDVCLDENGDVYACGNTEIGHTSLFSTPVIWKNGKESAIGKEDNGNTASAILSKQGTIYTIYNEDNNACLMTDDKRINLFEGNALCIYTDGNRVLIGGHTGILEDHERPVIWLDGKIIGHSGNGSINSIYTRHDTIFSVGYTGEYSNGRPALWINNHLETLDYSLDNEEDIKYCHIEKIIERDNKLYFWGILKDKNYAEKSVMWVYGDKVIKLKEESDTRYFDVIKGEIISLKGDFLMMGNQRIAKLKDAEMINNIKILSGKIYIMRTSTEPYPIETLDLGPKS